MLRKAFRFLVPRAAEVILSVALVLAAFLIILVLLGWLFPAGNSLRSLMRGDEKEGGGRVRPAADSAEVANEWDPVVATLTHAFRSVKDKQADTIIWEEAAVGMSLRDRHAVQTLDGSAATIRFDRGTLLRLGENSLIILKAVERHQRTSQTRASLIVLNGEMEALSLGGRAGGLELNVSSSSGLAKVMSRGQATVRVSVNPDKTSLFSVLRGSAEISAGGRRVTVGQGRWVTFDPSSGLGRVRRLSPTPEPRAPAPDAVFSYRSLPPRITFSWKGHQGDVGYRLDIARDRDFQDVVVGRNLTEPDFVHGNLKAGTYYWRVAATESRSRGLATDARRLVLVTDEEPPILEVVFPEGVVAANRILIKGSTEPGVRLFVGGTNVSTEPGGGFECTLGLDRGMNVVVVEAMDAAGNTTYRSRVVNAKY